ncbi:MAG: sulfatase, partial [Proteobacteria bacterium]|nr:sulfatase [Pseudomonadota bacterium]
MLYLLACLIGCGGATKEPPPPSVLLITLDTTRADRLGPYGYGLATTPTYDRLAHEGTVFERAYSSCPLTIPSHSTIFTGRYPPSHGVRDNGDFILGPDAITLAERYREAGWLTAAFTSAFPTQKRWGFAQGFHVYHDPLERQPTQLDWRDQRTADEVIDDALETLTKFDRDKPWFVWVHLFDAHWPYEPPEPFATNHKGRPYDGEIAFADSEVGRFLNWWEKQRSGSYTVITSDHGEGLGDGGEQTHGFLLHDGTMRVPLIVQGPKIEGGKRIKDPVGLVDIAPTLLDLTGLDIHPEVQGKNIFQGGSSEVYAEALTGQFNLGLAPLFSSTGSAGRYI